MAYSSPQSKSNVWPIDFLILILNKPNSIQSLPCASSGLCYGQDGLCWLPRWEGQLRAEARWDAVRGESRGHRGGRLRRCRDTAWSALAQGRADSCFVSLTRFISTAEKWESFQQLTRKSRNCSRTLRVRNQVEALLHSFHATFFLFWLTR